MWTVFFYQWTFIKHLIVYIMALCGRSTVFSALARTLLECRRLWAAIGRHGLYSKGEPIRIRLIWNGAGHKEIARPQDSLTVQQICIFKIELDPNIKSVYLSFVVPRPAGQLMETRPELVPDLEKEEAERAGYKVSEELSTNKRKVSSFADDLTAALKSDPDTVYRVRQALEQFGNISGLRTNVEKSTMMRIGRCTRQLDPGGTACWLPVS
jgi:hypothetical protein